MTGLDLAGEEELSRLFEPCLSWKTPGTKEKEQQQCPPQQQLPPPPIAVTWARGLLNAGLQQMIPITSLNSVARSIATRKKNLSTHVRSIPCTGKCVGTIHSWVLVTMP